MSIQEARAALQQGRFDDAIAAFIARELARDGSNAETWLELGGALKRAGRGGEAEALYRNLLAQAPHYTPARLTLGALLIDQQRYQEAESVSREGLRYPAPPQLAGVLHNNLGLSLRALHRLPEAIEHLEKAQALMPDLPGLDLLRADMLREMSRFDEALTLLEGLIGRQPELPLWHRAYNELLYQLDRNDDALKSYDRAPPTRELLLDKAYFLSHAHRREETLAVFRELVTRDPNDVVAAIGVANSLLGMKQYDEAALAFDAALAQGTNDPESYCCAAAVALHRNDPEKTVALCEQALVLDPHSQTALATLSVGLRTLGDERDEHLNRYDSLVRVFDLEPPAGFSSMEDFNAELVGYLETIHPNPRKYHNQTLRAGTQTTGNLFDGGHDLVDRIELRIREALNRYIGDMQSDAAHPFLSRRTHNIRYNGSWSSRLGDAGLSRQSHPSQGLDQQLLLCRRARSGEGRDRAPGLDQVRRVRLPASGGEKSAAPRGAARAGTAGAVSVLYVARHHSVPRAHAAHDNRFRRGAALSQHPVAILHPLAGAARTRRIARQPADVGRSCRRHGEHAARRRYGGHSRPRPGSWRDSPAGDRTCWLPLRERSAAVGLRAFTNMVRGQFLIAAAQQLVVRQPPQAGPEREAVPAVAIIECQSGHGCGRARHG